MDLPWYVNAVFGAVFLGLTFKLTALIRRNAPAKKAEYAEAKKLARRLADRGDYFVKDWRGCCLVVVTADDLRIREEVAFWGRHPDLDQIREVRRLDRVSFHYSDQPIGSLNRSDICAYLRLKAG